MKWWEKAAKAGHPDAMHNLAVDYATGAPGVPKDLAKSTQYFRDAANGGFGPAMVYLAMHLQNGIGCTANPEEADEWLRKSKVSEGLDAIVGGGKGMATAAAATATSVNQSFADLDAAEAENLAEVRAAAAAKVEAIPNPTLVAKMSALHRIAATAYLVGGPDATKVIADAFTKLRRYSNEEIERLTGVTSQCNMKYGASKMRWKRFDRIVSGHTSSNVQPFIPQTFKDRAEEAAKKGGKKGKTTGTLGRTKDKKAKQEKIEQMVVERDTVRHLIDRGTWEKMDVGAKMEAITDRFNEAEHPVELALTNPDDFPFKFPPELYTLPSGQYLL
jgi:hypothetical protein